MAEVVGRQNAAPPCFPSRPGFGGLGRAFLYFIISLGTNNANRLVFWKISSPYFSDADIVFMLLIEKDF